MHHNVAWKTDRIFFKGDEHFIYNNLSFDSNQNDLIISSDVKIQGHNHSTITRNNLANTMSEAGQNQELSFLYQVLLITIGLEIKKEET